MSSRPVVSYDDITLPYNQPEDPPNNPSFSSHSGHPPPSKKRKKNNNHNNQKAKRREDSNTFKNSNSQSAEFQKYLSNTNNSAKNRSPQQIHEAEGEVEGEEGEYEEEEEESRELTHQEIWDDSALVDAWEAAMEEYEAYHGPEKDWKKEPVKKSPLWYNVPVDPSRKSAESASAQPSVPLARAIPSVPPTDGIETDSKPLDFDTFVPTYDPSLDLSSVPATGPHAIPSTTSYIADISTGSMVSQDEAFQRALSAMYWSGYWTAMYHSQRQLSQFQPQVQTSTTQDPPVSTGDTENKEELEDDYEGEEIEVDEQDDEFIPTQR